MSSRRVVITGIGIVTSLGLTATTSWDNIINGQSGVKKITSFDTEHMPCKIASIIEHFSAENYIEARDLKRMDKFIHFGIAAAEEAIKDSNWQPAKEEDKFRTGVMLGSGIGGLQTISETAVQLSQSEKPKTSPYFIPASLTNLLAGHVSIRHGFAGPNSAVTTACSTGAHAIGDAMRMIQYGDADVMIAGGAEAPVNPLGIAGFFSARTLATNFNDRPTEASRPWDQDHAGFVMGEGAGVVVLEEYEHAKQRGAKIYAELAGYGLTGDAYHITSPNGVGARRAMQNALKDASLTQDAIDYINAHGTSTKVGDVIELETVQNLFLEHKKIKMSSTKSSIGHLLGAAGSVELIFTALAIRDQIAPPTLNLHKPLENAKINLVPKQAENTKISYAMSNSFGFGGTNASLVLAKL